MQDYLNQIIHSEWEKVLPLLPANSIDLVLTDPPYNTTALEFDKSPVDLSALWVELKRVCNPTSPIVITASQPFTTDLINSNRDWFRYEIIWSKSLTSDFINANRRPLKRHENIIVFSAKQAVYNPIKTTGTAYIKKNVPNRSKHLKPDSVGASININDGSRYPTSILEIPNPNNDSLHPTQKPVELFQYLIKTYSNPGATVLDCFAGSGTTAIAAYNTGRNFICIEKDAGYHAKAVKRLQDVQAQLRFDEMVG